MSEEKVIRSVVSLLVDRLTPVMLADLKGMDELEELLVSGNGEQLAVWVRQNKIIGKELERATNVLEWLFDDDEIATAVLAVALAHFLDE